MNLPGPQPISVLVVEDNPADLLLIQEMLAEVSTALFHLETAVRLADGMARLRQKGADVVLLDLMLPDSDGLSTLRRIRECAPEVPVVVLTGVIADELAAQAIQGGAQDYLVKGHLDPHELARAIRHALERNRLLNALKEMTLNDELTGLYNRRGLMTLGEHQVKIAQRTGQGLMLLYFDVDDLKAINDTFGHQEGDRALQQIARCLQQVFRASDIVARLGGDEFAVLVLDLEPQTGAALVGRLIEALQAVNASVDRRYVLSVSGGTALLDHSQAEGLPDLLARADSAMYLHKQRQVRHAGAGVP
jgi:two-component system, cell cycle response regulator